MLSFIKDLFLISAWNPTRVALKSANIHPALLPTPLQMIETQSQHTAHNLMFKGKFRDFSRPGVWPNATIYRKNNASFCLVKLHFVLLPLRIITKIKQDFHFHSLPWIFQFTAPNLHDTGEHFFPKLWDKALPAFNLVLFLEPLR